MINLKHVDASYLSFDENNIPNYKGSGHPIDVLGFSAYAMDIPILMSNENFYGYIVDSAVHSPSKHRDLVSTEHSVFSTLKKRKVSYILYVY